jgi:hypothetical protein
MINNMENNQHVTNNIVEDQSSMGNTISDSGARIDDSSSVAGTENRFLDYPRDFFDLKEGANPTSQEAAALLWQYRKGRPPAGVADRQHPNGAAMLKEIQEIRKSLRVYVANEYKNGAIAAAKEYSLLLPNTNSAPIDAGDLRTAIQNLSPSNENYEKAFRVFHLFCRTRVWLANVIDGWMLENNMRLMPPPDVDDADKARSYEHERGGFSRVASQAKAQEVKKYMAALFSKQKWCVATMWKKGKGKTYRKVILQTNDLQQSEPGHSNEFWVASFNSPSSSVSSLML